MSLKYSNKTRCKYCVKRYIGLLFNWQERLSKKWKKEQKNENLKINSKQIITAQSAVKTTPTHSAHPYRLLTIQKPMFINRCANSLKRSSSVVERVLVFNSLREESRVMLIRRRIWIHVHVFGKNKPLQNYNASIAVVRRILRMFISQRITSRILQSA